MTAPAAVTLLPVAPLMLELNSERLGEAVIALHDFRMIYVRANVWSCRPRDRQLQPIDALLALAEAGFRTSYVKGSGHRYRIEDTTEIGK